MDYWSSYSGPRLFGTVTSNTEQATVLGFCANLCSGVTYEERLRQERGSGNMDAVQRWYTRPITEQSQYEFDDLYRDFLRLTYSKGAEFPTYLSITGCYTRLSKSPAEGLLSLKEPEVAWSASITGV